MKKIFFVLGLCFLFACGNQSAENKPTDLDRTKNNDTGAVKTDTANNKKDSTDTTRMRS